MDDERASLTATEHLIELGHKRIGFIGGSREYALSQWRADGWSAAMASARLPTEDLFVQGDFSFGSGDAAARRLLRLPDRVTAIIGSNDQMTLAALDVARELGLRVPDDLSLVSFDNTPIVRFTLPALTAVDQPIAATASRAVELIIEAQRGGPLPTEPVVVPASLVRRQSTGRVPDRPS
jgi:LacI family transcriptional regulator